MSALEDRLCRFAYEWHEAMNSPYTVNMMPLLSKAASDVRSLAAPSLEAENAKLRELCKDLLDGYECGYGRACDGCGYNGFDGQCQVRDRARELGVEVDG